MILSYVISFLWIFNYWASIPCVYDSLGHAILVNEAKMLVIEKSLSILGFIGFVLMLLYLYSKITDNKKLLPIIKIVGLIIF